MVENTIIRRISFDRYFPSVDNLITLLRDLKPTEKIHLTLVFMNRAGFRFSETVELRELILQKNSNIHHLVVFNCFEFLIQFLLANNGETKHFSYFGLIKRVPIQLERGNRLSDAMRSNNIESFAFSGRCNSSEVFQPVLDALLATRVQDLELDFEFLENNDVNGGNNIDFSSISTNTSLKELKVDAPLDMTHLFDSMKGNKTVEKLVVNNRMVANFRDKEKLAFNEMLRKNCTLLDVTFNICIIPIIQEQVNIFTKLNWMWIRYKIVKLKERIAAAATAAISTTTITTVATTIDNATVKRRTEEDNAEKVENNKKIEEEKKTMKKKKEINLWLKTFEKKPAICNEFIYLFLTENADMYNNNVAPSKVVSEKKKKKRQK